MTSTPILLISDLHLTDNPLEEYRWRVFEQVEQLCIEHAVKTVFILGDPWDRKDRHSAVLVNRTVACLASLYSKTECRIAILMGNHDELVGGGSFWSFLNELEGILYVTKPMLFHNSIWLLPFSKNPKEEWSTLPLANASAMFIHQTVAGSLVENDRVLTVDSNPMPPLPVGVPVYSGDVHRPQQVGQITYVGCPYPVRFGEDWGGRALLLEDPENLAKYQAIPLETIRRLILDVASLEELERRVAPDSLQEIVAGDQIRVRYHLTADQLTGWGVKEAAIKDWAKKYQVQLLSVEAVLTTTIAQAADTAVGQLDQAVEALPPADVLRLFAAEEKLGDTLLARGLELLQQVEVV